MKPDRQSLMGSLRDQEEKVVIARVLDDAEKVLKNHRPLLTNFYDPYHAGLIISVLERIPDLEFSTYGGYPAAERVRIAMFPDYMDENEIAYETVVLAVEGNFKMVQATHRDFLGSILGLGIKREMVGDLLVTDTGCQVVVTREVASYLSTHLTRVHRVRVSVREILPEELVLPEVRVKEIKTTVASLRIDAVAAAGFGTSRTRLAREILAEKLSLNWHTCANAASPVRQGDIISLRGRGRIELAEVRGNTKSGRIGIVIKRFL
ncbi:photosystem II S4 domain protein [Desulfotomaculum varum]